MCCEHQVLTLYIIHQSQSQSQPKKRKKLSVGTDKNKKTMKAWLLKEGLSVELGSVLLEQVDDIDGLSESVFVHALYQCFILSILYLNEKNKTNKPKAWGGIPQGVATETQVKKHPSAATIREGLAKTERQKKYPNR